MSIKTIFKVLASIVVLIFLMKIVLPDSEPESGRVTQDEKAFLHFNNNNEECNYLPPNKQYLRQYLSQEDSFRDNHDLGLGYFYLGQTYIAFANLLQKLHIDLYDMPIYKNAKPALPISQILEPNPLVDMQISREKVIFEKNKIPKKWSKDVRDLLKMYAYEEDYFLQQSATDIKTAYISKSEFFLSQPEKILASAYWSLKKSKSLLMDTLKNEKSPSPKNYITWLPLLSLSEYYVTDWNNIPLHDAYISSLQDSIANSFEIGKIIEALPICIRNNWISKGELKDAFNQYDYSGSHLIIALILEKSKHIGTKNDENTVIPISGFEKYSDDSIIYPKLVLWVAEHLYTIGDYNKAMKIITKFWYDSVNSHPLDEWCFDNYPEFMIQSYTVGRWDGARLPLFIKDFSDMVHQDPILTSGMELLQFYNGEIMSSISSSTSNNNIE